MTWMNLLSLIFTGMNIGMAGTDIAELSVPVPPVIEIGEVGGTGSVTETPAVCPDDNSYYLVVESLNGDTATVECPRGLFDMPAALLPESAAYEGAVIAWEHRPDEAERRLADGHARIRRMQNIGAY